MMLISKLLMPFIRIAVPDSAVKLGLVILFGLFNVSAAQANTISGRVSLPSGIVAPNGGLSITLRSLFIDTFGFGRDRVTIAAGQSSVDYSLIFSDDVDRDIVFECEACSLLDVTTEGGWSNSDGVVGDFSAQTFPGDQDHVVNILLERADTFMGRLSLPLGLMANGGEFLFVSISSSGIFGFGDGEILGEGQTFFDFAIGLPSDGTRDSWEISFVCLGCEDRIEAANHYATSEDGGAPTLDRGSAFSFMTNMDFDGISLTLIDNESAARPRNPDSNAVLPSLLLLLDED